MECNHEQVVFWDDLLPKRKRNHYCTSCYRRLIHKGKKFVTDYSVGVYNVEFVAGLKSFTKLPEKDKDNAFNAGIIDNV